MNIPSRRTVEGFITATDERITDIKQLKADDLVMMGFVELHDFLPYRVINVEGKLYLTNVSSVTKHRFRQLAVPLDEASLETILLYRAEIDTSDKTHPGLTHVAGLVLILAVIAMLLTLRWSSTIALIIGVVSIILACMCYKAAKMPRY